MFPRNFSVLPLLLFLLALLALHRPVALSQEIQLGGLSHIVARDGDHGHGHHHLHDQPLLEVNETEVLMYHAPTPPSYYTIDWEDPENVAQRHPGFILAHALFMGLAFFVALPVAIILRSVKHAGHPIAVATFYAFAVLGCMTGGLYTKMTPNMYEGSIHGKQGYMWLLLAVVLSVIDFLAGIRRFVAFLRTNERKSLKLFWNWVVLNRDPDHVVGTGPEYRGLVEEPEELELPKINDESSSLESTHQETAQWANEVHHHRRNFSMVSERTLYGSRSPTTHSDDTLANTKLSLHVKPRSFLHRIGNGVFAVLERTLVIAGFAQLLTGIVVYTGGCRENYINGCLAHLIKGGIFWCYGLLTFARFLGSFGEFGWAWNKAPIDTPCTAEFIESFVIFLYGASNTWMERFGAKPGDPFTTKQIQHISIAIMFWFAGLIGMGMESKRVRKWLAASIFNSAGHTQNVSQDTVIEPPSYRGSFNPFPALVIGVTGAAMSAHFQEYLFEVQIHALWGNALVAFAVFRCLTYFFLWVAPPKSILPSRPPTEVLGSFFLACGGLLFIFSTEEISLAAIRRGRDDVMMFLNVAVAITCLAFCWTLAMVGVKGWLRSRHYTGATYRSEP